MLTPFDFAVTPFDYNRLYGPEKYGLNNMLLKMANFPAQIETSVDRAFTVYFDRVPYHALREALKLVKTDQTGDAYIHGATDESFLAFVGKLFALIENSEKFTARQKELFAALTDTTKEISPESHLEYDEAAWRQAAEEIKPLPISGAVCIRFTNVSSGYPCEFVAGVIQKSKLPTYSGNAAPFVIRPRNRRSSLALGFDEAYND